MELGDSAHVRKKKVLNGFMIQANKDIKHCTLTEELPAA
jgi:hypothetical protein